MKRSTGAIGGPEFGRRREAGDGHGGHADEVGGGRPAHAGDDQQSRSLLDAVFGEPPVQASAAHVFTCAIF